jgi:predicted kinase
MPNLTVLSGLPASGKTTKAKKIMKETGNTVRLNKDLLSEMMFFSEYKPTTRKVLVQAEKDMAYDLLIEGHNVIIDDTNLDQSYWDAWREIAERTDSKFKLIKLDTPLDVCLERNENREGRVPPHVITNFALQYNMIPEPENGWVLCDLDGTLCNIEHRLHFAKSDPKDWDNFFAGVPQDTLRKDVEQQLYDKTSFPDLHDVIFVSARPERCRVDTEKWLGLNCAGINYTALIMRGDDDRRPDTQVKQSYFNKYFKDKKIKCVFDDRPSVIEVWKSNGLEVIDCGTGEPF